MSLDYKGLFKLMEENNIKKYDLRKLGIHSAVVNRLVKNENVNTSTIQQLCKLLNCQPGDIMEYIQDEQPDHQPAKDK